MFSQQYDNYFPTYIIILLTFKRQNRLFALNLSTPYFSGYSKYKNCLTLIVPLPTRLQGTRTKNRSNQVNVTPGLMLLEDK
jgi:hypothetical protein